MARIRTIKPEFWTDEKIMESSPSARLLLIGVLNFADDKGNIEAGPLSIKAKIFPSDNIDVRPLLSELEKNQLLTPYSVNGENYYNIRGFLKHQKIDNPSKARCPLYDPSETTPGGLPEDSVVEGKGREGKVKELKHIEREGEDEITVSHFELIYDSYPEKKGKAKAQKHFMAQIKTQEDWLYILNALDKYIAEVDRCRKNGHPDLSYQHASTWFNKSWRDYINYKPPAKQSPDGIQKPQQLGKEELKAKIDEQIKFVQEEILEGALFDSNWFHRALGTYVCQYVQRFSESPLSGENLRFFNDLKAELELKNECP